MKLSIVIPVLNEAENLSKLLPYLKEHSSGKSTEIIVVDGGSTDASKNICLQYQVKYILSNMACRSIQMNLGAKHSDGEILYFVHADTVPPSTFVTDILEHFCLGYEMGCYRFKFDSKQILLKLNAYFTRFDKLWCRGGDQTFFITKQLFEQSGGYRDDHSIMEEYEYFTRMKPKHSFVIIPKSVTVSARKYDTNSYLRVQCANFLVFYMWKRKYPQEKLVQTYKKLLNYR